ncbi:MAG: hypothetical protein RI897_4051 [Verrucomicrobiota bacterium]|jgi:hypothetical protein
MKRLSAFRLSEIGVDVGLFFAIVFPIGIIITLHSVYLSGISEARMSSQADAAFVAEVHRMAQRSVLYGSAAGALLASGIWGVVIRFAKRKRRGNGRVHPGPGPEREPGGGRRRSYSPSAAPSSSSRLTAPPDE